MKKIITAVCTLAIINITFAQTKEIRELDGFTEISTSSSIKVVVNQGNEYIVEVVANENNISNIITRLDAKKLEISIKQNWLGEQPTVYITTPILEKITTSGASEVKGKGLIKTSYIHLTSSGGSKITLNINAEKTKINASGGTEIQLSGFSDHITIVSSGAATTKAANLEVNSAKVSLSGGSYTSLNVKEFIEGSTSGGSELHFSGDAEQQIAKSGASTINENQTRNSIYSDEVEIKNDIIGDVVVKEHGDTTRISIGKKKLLIIDDIDKTKVDLDLKDTTKSNWKYGIDGMILGVNGYLNSSNQLQVPNSHDFLELDISRSVNFQINALDANIEIYKNYITFHPGLGLEFNSYEFRKNYWLEPSSNNNVEITAQPALNSDSTTLSFKKNRLKDTYLNAPIMFAFHTHKDHKKAFHLGLGGYIGVRLTSKMKYKYELNGNSNKDKVKNDFYLNPFRYGLMASVGYSNINIFANYALNGMFEKGKGPQLHPFSVGIMILGF